MFIKRILAIVLFLALFFIYHWQDNKIIEGTEQGISYRIEIEDSLSVFYFQCPLYHWQIDDVPTVWINGFDYDPAYEDVWCDTEIHWEIFPEPGDSLSLTTTHRTVMAEQLWGWLIFALLLWLLIGSFSQAQAWDRLAVFNVLWAFSYIMHFISYEYWRTTFWDGSVASIFPMLALMLVLVNPRSIIPLIVLAVTQLFEYWVMSPYASNHTLVIVVVNAILLITLASLLFRSGSIQLDREQFYESFAPILRVMLLILYFWAWFHKLNSDFVNPLASCVVEFYTDLHVDYPIFPQSEGVHSRLIMLTFLVEGGLPLLLLFRPTRLIAILMGIGFHGTLGMITFRDFTALMFNFYFVFLSVEALTHIKALRPAFFDKIPAWLQHLLWAIVILPLFLALPGISYEQFDIRAGIIANVVYVLLATIITVYLLYQQWIKRDKNLFAPILRPSSILLWIVLALMLINGAMPYIGLKTNNAFDMYSNLRVEGESNHFLPINGHLFNYPDDIVEVISASDDFFYAAHLNYVFLDFREMVYQQQADYVEFRRNGEIFFVEWGDYEAVLGARLPLLLRKFMIFEPVSREAVNPCSH